jgi:hypothetical protein
MTTKQHIAWGELDERTRQAVDELQRLITSRFPTTTFELVRSPDNPAAIHLLAVADVDDPDAVGDLVVERVVSLQVEENIPLHVIPLRTPERVEAALAADRRDASQRTGRAISLLGGSA